MTDVPGLTFSVVPVADGWRLEGRLQLKGRRVRLGGGGVVPATVSPSPMLVDGAADWHVADSFPNRGDLVDGLAATSASLVDDLHAAAGDRWPPPPERRS
jgi:hypothetical protein